MMSYQMLFSRFTIALALACVCTTAAAAGISASGGGDGNTTTQYDGNSSGFAIDEGVAYDPSAGPWIKQLTNTGNGIASGNRVNITETLTNIGPYGWTDWHEEIITTTTGGGGGGGGGGGEPQLGFVFDKDFLSLMADYGSGFEALVENVDYSVMSMPYEGPGAGGDNMGLQAIWILFEPHAVIQTDDVLKIEKQIFEVYLDGNIWQQDEFVEIVEYPTIPEPSVFVLAAIGLLSLSIGRQRRH